MSKTGNTITLETREGGVFKGKIEKGGKMKGTYELDGNTYEITLSKYGEGHVRAKEGDTNNYKIDRKSGVVIY